MTRLLHLYRDLDADPRTRWLLLTVWAGLGLVTFMAAAYIPLLIERRAVLTAAGCST